MKSTGIVRRVDGLGRIVVPVELRQLFNVNAGNEVEIWLEDGAVAICKYTPACLFCGGSEGLERYRGKWVCLECLGGLAASGTLEEGTTGAEASCGWCNPMGRSD